MKEFVRMLLSENNSELSIGLFDIWHFLYLFVILGGGILLSFLFCHRDEQTKDKVLRIFAGLVIGLYIADFFLMPLSDTYNGIAQDKLPFHICTLMGVLTPFAQYNKKFSNIKHVIVILGMAGALMWMAYPGSALGGEPPFCYRIFQTFMYHGVLFIWGLLNLTLGTVKLDIKKIWMELCGILMLLVWAWIGNSLYDNQNWFFIETSIFPFLSDEIMPPVVVFCVFGVCLVIYGAYYLINAIVRHPAKVKADEPIMAMSK